jgi:hypothetical protein
MSQFMRPRHSELVQHDFCSRNGAYIIVAGRPILKAADRNKIIKEILSVIEELRC